MKRNNNKASDQTRDTRVPENNPSKAMDSKREVEQSNDAKTDQDFPGYPHYPAKEDIMDQRTGSHQVDVDMENLASARNATGVSQRFSTIRKNPPNPSVPNFSSNKNDEGDLDELNSTNDEIGIAQNVSNQDINTDLDIPGSELDDAEENIGEEDEENNYYSLGGDRHESQEEDPYSGPERGNV